MNLPSPVQVILHTESLGEDMAEVSSSLGLAPDTVFPHVHVTGLDQDQAEVGSIAVCSVIILLLSGG